MDLGRSAGLATSSKLEVSSSSEASLASLSANLEAMFEIEVWLSFIDGGGSLATDAGLEFGSFWLGLCRGGCMLGSEER